METDILQTSGQLGNSFGGILFQFLFLPFENEIFPVFNTVFYYMCGHILLHHWISCRQAAGFVPSMDQSRLTKSEGLEPYPTLFSMQLVFSPEKNKLVTWKSIKLMFSRDGAIAHIIAKPGEISDTLHSLSLSGLKSS